MNEEHTLEIQNSKLGVTSTPIPAPELEEEPEQDDEDPS